MTLGLHLTKKREAVEGLYGGQAELGLVVAHQLHVVHVLAAVLLVVGVTSMSRYFTSVLSDGVADLEGEGACGEDKGAGHGAVEGI